MWQACWLRVKNNQSERCFDTPQIFDLTEICGHWTRTWLMDASIRSVILTQLGCCRWMTALGDRLNVLPSDQSNEYLAIENVKFNLFSQFKAAWTFHFSGCRGKKSFLVKFKKETQENLSSRHIGKGIKNKLESVAAPHPHPILSASLQRSTCGLSEGVQCTRWIPVSLSRASRSRRAVWFYRVEFKVDLKCKRNMSPRSEPATESVMCFSEAWYKYTWCDTAVEISSTIKHCLRNVLLLFSVGRWANCCAIVTFLCSSRVQLQIALVGSL